jgi:hypothetical protein
MKARKGVTGPEIVAVLCTLAVVALMYVVVQMASIPPHQEVAIRLDRENTLNEHANWLAQNAEFIKEPRSGLCFIYVWRGANSYIWRGVASGGPVLATVPCESIPPGLLHTGQS